MKKILNLIKTALVNASGYYGYMGEEEGKYIPLDSALSIVDNIKTENDWITDRVPTREECGEYGGKMFQVTIQQPNGNKTSCMTYEYTKVRGNEVARWLWNGRIAPWTVLAWKPLDEPWTEE